MNKINIGQVPINQQRPQGSSNFDARTIAAEMLDAGFNPKVIISTIEGASTMGLMPQKKTPEEIQATETEKAGTLGSIDLINQISSNSGAISGPIQTGLIPFTQGAETANKYDQLKGILSLENRAKLKGSGAISDFESKTLEKAASALGRNLSEESFKTVLAEVRGVFESAAKRKGFIDQGQSQNQAGPSLDNVQQFINQDPNNPEAQQLSQMIKSGQLNQENFQDFLAGNVQPQQDNPDEGGFFQDVAGSFKDRMGNIAESRKAYDAGDQNLASGLFQSFGQTAGFASDIVGAGVSSVASAITPDAIEEPVKQGFQELVKRGMQTETAQNLISKYQEFKQKNPEIAANLEATANVADLASNLFGLGIAKKGLVKAGEEAIESVLKGGVGVKNIAQRKGRQAVVSKIEELISPGMTTREAQMASNEGRVIRGKSSALFGTKEDTIIPSERVKKAAQTIDSRIPNASKLDDQQLSSRLKNEISTIANDIKPDMKAIEVSKESIKSVLDKSKEVFKSQLESPDFEAFGGKSMQRNFGNYLNEAKKSLRGMGGKFRNKSLDDLWEIRQKYDKSIPSRIKRATSMSDSRAQYQKDLWLENRSLLNDMINDTSKGLGEKSRRAFSDMSDMHMSRENIASKTKVMNSKPGIINKSSVFKVGAGLVGGTVLGKTAGMF